MYCHDTAKRHESEELAKQVRGEECDTESWKKLELLKCEDCKVPWTVNEISVKDTVPVQIDHETSYPPQSWDE